MKLGWLLFQKSFRSNWRRLALTSGAVALGILMLLLFTAVFHGLSSTGDHTFWRTAIYQQQGKAANGQDRTVAGQDALWALLTVSGNLSQWRDQPIWTASFYAEGPNAPALKGLPNPPAGQYYVSPALMDIIKQHPGENIGQRYGDTLAGTIPARHLSSPDELAVIRGMSQDEARAGHATPMYTLEPIGMTTVANSLINNIIYLGIFILLFPVILFISIATQLGSAQREQRYAALRLVGATRRQVTGIIAFESLVAAVLGMVAGIAMYLAALPLTYQFRLDGQRFWPADIQVPPLQFGLIIVGTLALVMLANWWGMRHVQLSPLGVSRHQNISDRPRWWRAIILGLGVAAIGYARLNTPNDAADQNTILLVIAAVMLIMIGLVVAGPWLTNLISRIISRRTANAQVLLGTRYLSAHSSRVFRSVSGVVVALFAASFYLTATSGIAQLEISMRQNNGFAQLQTHTVAISSPQLPDDLADQLAQQPYVQSTLSTQLLAQSVAMIPCREVDTYTTLSCPVDTKFVGVNLNAPINQPKLYGNTMEDLTSQLTSKLSIDPSIVKQTEPFYLVTLSDHGDIDKLRSLVAATIQPITINPGFVTSGYDAQSPSLNPIIGELANLAYAGLVVTMLVAIASLLVATIGGLWERRRTLMTLRLSGMEIGQIRQMVIIESLIPLIATSIVSAAAGVGVGYVFMQLVSASLDAAISPLYALIVLGSLTMAALGIYAVLPLLNQITDLENNRTE